MTNIVDLITNGAVTILGIGAVALLVKWILSAMQRHLESLEASWAKYTDRLTTAVEKMGSELTNVKHDLKTHAAKDEQALGDLEDTLDRRFEQLSGLIHGLKHG